MAHNGIVTFDEVFAIGKQKQNFLDLSYQEQRIEIKKEVSKSIAELTRYLKDIPKDGEGDYDERLIYDSYIKTIKLMENLTPTELDQLFPMQDLRIDHFYNYDMTINRIGYCGINKAMGEQVMNILEFYPNDEIKRFLSATNYFYF